MLTTLYARLCRFVAGNPRRREVSPYRPHLESLEARVVPAAMNGSAPSIVDLVYLVHAQQGNETEVILGVTAMQNASNPAVKQFGQTLAQDHFQAMVKEMAVLQQAGLPGLIPLGQDNMADIQQFQSVGGNQGSQGGNQSSQGGNQGSQGNGSFDIQFSQYMVQDHIQDIFIGQLEQQLGSFQPAINYAIQSAPMLQKHLAIAESLVSQLTGFNFGGNGNNQSDSGMQNSNGANPNGPGTVPSQSNNGS